MSSYLYAQATFHSASQWQCRRINISSINRWSTWLLVLRCLSSLIPLQEFSWLFSVYICMFAMVYILLEKKIPNSVPEYYSKVATIKADFQCSWIGCFVNSVSFIGWLWMFTLYKAPYISRITFSILCPTWLMEPNFIFIFNLRLFICQGNP